MVAHVGGSCGVRFLSLFVSLFVRRYTVSQKPMQLGSLRLTQRVLEIHLIWGQKVKGQSHEAQKTVRRRGILHYCEC